MTPGVVRVGRGMAVDRAPWADRRLCLDTEGRRARRRRPGRPARADRGVGGLEPVEGRPGSLHLAAPERRLLVPLRPELWRLAEWVGGTAGSAVIRCHRRWPRRSVGRRSAGEQPDDSLGQSQHCRCAYQGRALNDSNLDAPARGGVCVIGALRIRWGIGILSCRALRFVFVSSRSNRVGATPPGGLVHTKDSLNIAAQLGDPPGRIDHHPALPAMGPSTPDSIATPAPGTAGSFRVHQRNGTGRAMHLLLTARPTAHAHSRAICVLHPLSISRMAQTNAEKKNPYWRVRTPSLWAAGGEVMHGCEDASIGCPVSRQDWECRDHALLMRPYGPGVSGFSCPFQPSTCIGHDVMKPLQRARGFRSSFLVTESLLNEHL